MADTGQSACFSDPNFAVICSFLKRFGENLGLPNISTIQLAEDIEDTKGVSELLEQIHVFLMRRLVRSLKREEWQKQLAKLCSQFSEVDAWECNKKGYRKLNVSTKLRILKFLLESQFDRNNKFREKISDLDPAVLRFLPIGRDRNGLAYWYFVDHEYNIQVYREEQDDTEADTWGIICRNRDDLANLVFTLQSAPVSITTESSRAATPCDDALQEKEKTPSSDNTENEDPSKKQGASSNNNDDGVKDIHRENVDSEINGAKSGDKLPDNDDNNLLDGGGGIETKGEINQDGVIGRTSSQQVDVKNEPAEVTDNGNTENLDDKNAESLGEESGDTKSAVKCENQTLEKECIGMNLDMNKEALKQQVLCMNDDGLGDKFSHDSKPPEGGTGSDGSVKDNGDDGSLNDKDGGRKTEGEDLQDDADSDDGGEKEMAKASTKLIKGRSRVSVAKQRKKKVQNTVDENFSPRRSQRARKPVIVEAKEETGEVDGSESEKEKDTPLKKGASAVGNKKMKKKKKVSSDDESFKFENESESGDSDYCPKSKKKRKAPPVETSDPSIPDDTPCNKCLKFNHPDLMLLCDKCDQGYHMSCVRPPLMVVPEGEWFCQPCDHEMLIERLKEALTDLDAQSKKRERLMKRQERLAFVGISLNNILPMEKQSESEAESSGSFDQERSMKKKKNKSDTFVKRSCRQRKQISYKFEEYDELINEALDDDPQEGVEHDERPAKPERRVSGKDISNIIGLENEVDDKPVVRKKARRLTALDDEAEASDESEEYQASESASEQNVDSSYSEESEASDDWGDVTWGRSKGRRQGLRKPKRKKTYRERWDYGMDDFVVDEYDSEEDRGKRRSSRVQARQKRATKNVISSDEEIESTPDESEESDVSSEGSDYRIKNKWNNKTKKKSKTGRKAQSKRKRVIESDSDDSAVDVKSHSRKKTKKRVSDDSSSDDDDDNCDDGNDKSEDDSDVSGPVPIRKSQRSSKRVTNFKNLLNSDDEEEDNGGEKGEEADDESTLGEIEKCVPENGVIEVKGDSVHSAGTNGAMGEAEYSEMEQKPTDSFMIDNLLRDTTKAAKSAVLDNDDDLDLEGVTDLISYVTEDDR